MNLNADDEAHIVAMRQAVEEMAEIPTLWRWLKQFNGEEQVDFTSATQALVQHVRLRAAFEHEGKHNRGLHVHILVEVTHTTMVQISKEGVASIFRAACKRAPNVHCRFLRGDDPEAKQVILKYITKEVPPNRLANQNNNRLRSVFGKSEDVVDSEMGR